MIPGIRVPTKKEFEEAVETIKLCLWHRLLVLSMTDSTYGGEQELKSVYIDNTTREGARRLYNSSNDDHCGCLYVDSNARVAYLDPATRIRVDKERAKKEFDEELEKLAMAEQEILKKRNEINKRFEELKKIAGEQR